MAQQQQRRATLRLLSGLLLLGLGAALEFEMQTQSKCIYEEINANVIVVGDFRAFNKDNAEIPVFVDVRVRAARSPGRPAAPPAAPDRRLSVWRFPHGGAGGGPARRGAVGHARAGQGPVRLHLQDRRRVQGVLHGGRCAAARPRPWQPPPARERQLPAPPAARSPAAAAPGPADIQTAFHTKLKLDWKTGVAAADWESIAKKEHLDSLTVEMRKLEGTIREVYNEMIQLQQREQELRDLNGARRAAAGAAGGGCCGCRRCWGRWVLRWALEGCTLASCGAGRGWQAGRRGDTGAGAAR
jgi:hypothetical protein